ncbi:MAG TPA: thioesterase family protein [Propionibacteriaceae bacterium]|nr:thioesterase family protein [Propionibacteriaceae bacterium]
MDAQGHLNNASYVDYLQEARVDFLLTGPPAMQQLLSTGVLVVSHAVEYRAPVSFGEQPLDIDLWAESVGGSRFVIAYDVFDGDTLAVQARTSAVPFDLATNRLRRLTTEERAHLSALVDPAEPLEAFPRVPLSERSHGYPLKVRWSDLDSYGHVNNVKFFDYIQEARIAFTVEVLGWAEDDVWLVVRQDLDYLKPMDFSLQPYEVATVVTAIGNKSFRLAAEIRDPTSGDVLAAARTVVVSAQPLTDERRRALESWLLPAD